MKVYVASGLVNIEVARAFMQDLRKVGHSITYDWTTHGPASHLGREKFQKVAENELQGVLAADALVVRLPGARGTHVEMGVALGSGIPVIVYGTAADFVIAPSTCAFYHLPRVRQVTGFRECLHALDAIQESK